MTFLILRSGDHRRMPWQNGGGITYEVARTPADGPTPFVWRISIAEVASEGPFSSLPGIDRIIMLIDGAQMVLTVDGVERPLKPRQPFAFSGDSRVTCAVPSPTRDLNVMTRRGSARATVEVVRSVMAQEVDPGGAGELAVVCIDGPARVSVPMGEAADLDALDVAQFDGSDSVTVSGPGTWAVVRIWVTASPREGC